MTIRISLKAVGFVLYTLALLGAAFGISYAVFEWRDDESFDASTIERRIDELGQQVEAGPTEAELNAQKCAVALEAAGNAEPTVARNAITGELLPWGRIQMAIDRYCK